MRGFKTTAEIKVPSRLIDQIIGQDKAVEIIKKAASQKRNVLLIGSPGTGKSMLAQAMSELLPVEYLEDVLVYPNPNNENSPLVKAVRTYPDEGYLLKNQDYAKFYTAKEIMEMRKRSGGDGLADALKVGLGRRVMNYKKMMDEQMPANGMSFVLFALLAILVMALIFYFDFSESVKWLVMAGVFGIAFLYIISNATTGITRRFAPADQPYPKLIVDNNEKKTAPFVDGTGTKAGALLGDVRHDPLQTGGLGTPAHLRVEAGAIHRASKGVLFIDEIASLKWHWQQELLTAMQEKKYCITGQSELGSGALVKTEPVPSDFVLVAAGNLPDLQQIHPALRSRIRGAGYEIYVEDSMEDSPENEDKLVQFVAQEVTKDGKIPHFTREAVEEVIEQGRRMAGRKKKLTLNLRELGGLVRAAGDIARQKGAKATEKEHLIEAKKVFTSIESQLSSKIIERKREYQMIATTGSERGRVNGLAVIGESSGLVLPIVAEVTPAASKNEGKVIATGKLGTIAKEAVDNVSAIVKKQIGTDISGKDIHIQFLQTYEGVEGDSASISIAVAVLSAMSGIPVRQDYAMTGSIDVRGAVLPVGGVTAKIEAALESGLKKVLIPKANEGDVYLGNRKDEVEVIPVGNIGEVLEHALEDCKEKKELLQKMKKQFR